MVGVRLRFGFVVAAVVGVAVAVAVVCGCCWHCVCCGCCGRCGDCCCRGPCAMCPWLLRPGLDVCLLVLEVSSCKVSWAMLLYVNGRFPRWPLGSALLVSVAIRRDAPVLLTMCGSVLHLSSHWLGWGPPPLQPCLDHYVLSKNRMLHMTSCFLHGKPPGGRTPETHPALPKHIGNTSHILKHTANARNTQIAVLAV